MSTVGPLSQAAYTVRMMRPTEQAAPSQNQAPDHTVERRPYAGPRLSPAGAILVPLLLYAILRLAYFASGLYWPSDSRWSVHTAVSILHEGDTDLNEYRDLMGPRGDYTLQRIDDKILTIYPPGASLLAVPYVAVLDGYAQALTGDGLPEYLHEHGAGRLERMIASSLTALSVVCLYSLLRRHLPLGAALGLALGYGVATSAWATASLALWQHTPTLLLFTLTLWLLDLARERPAFIQYAGLTLALSFVCRPTNAIAIIAITVYVAWFYRRYLLRFLLWAAPVAAAFVAYSLSVYGRIFPDYYLMRGIANTADFWEGLVGTLFSPNRGLLIWSPIVLFAFYGLYLRLRAKSFDRLDGLLWSIIGLHWLLIASWAMWWGGYSMGPRFFTDVLPFYALLSVPALQQIRQQRLFGKIVTITLLVATILYGGFVQYRCASQIGPAQWGGSPVSVDIAPARLWDWRDIQFLRANGEKTDLRAGLRVGWWPRFEFDAEAPGKGWSISERNPFGESYTWMDKRQATFLIEVRKPTDVEISFRVLNWLSDETLDSLIVTLQDTPVELERAFDEQGAAIYRGHLPAQAFTKGQRTYALMFTVDHTHSPTIKDPTSTDPRKLALALDWIAFEPVER